MRNKQAVIYIMASSKNGTIYIGVTNNLITRVWQHKSDMIKGFSKKYKVHRLVYFKQHTSMQSAIEREKQIKKWKRQWKLKLIEKLNPAWKDLYTDII